MIGTILQKPVAPDDFRQAMVWCCDPENNARLLEYADRYEVAARPEEQDPEPVATMPEASIEERLDDIENALIELAEIVARGE